MGKTHLAQAIGIAIKEKFQEKIVLYVSANRFMTQFIDAVNVKNKMTDFIKKGMEPNEAYEKSKGTYGRFAEAAKYIDPRKE